MITPPRAVASNVQLQHYEFTLCMSEVRTMHLPDVPVVPLQLAIVHHPQMETSTRFPPSPDVMLVSTGKEQKSQIPIKPSPFQRIIRIHVRITTYVELQYPKNVIGYRFLAETNCNTETTVRRTYSPVETPASSKQQAATTTNTLSHI